MGRDINKELASLKRTPSLEEVIDNAIFKQLSGMHVALPGSVQRYDKATQTADIEISYPDFFSWPDGKGGKFKTYPGMINVPVAQFKSDEFFIHLELQVGSFVMVHFADRNLFEFRKGRNPHTYTAANFPFGEAFGFNGAFAVPVGVYPNSEKIKHPGYAGITIGSDDNAGMRINLEKDKITISTGAGVNLELSGKDESAKMTLGTGAFSALIAEKVQVLWEAAAAIYLAHTHQTPAGPSSTPSTPLPPWDPTANSQSAKIPK